MAKAIPMAKAKPIWKSEPNAVTPRGLEELIVKLAIEAIPGNLRDELGHPPLY